MERVLSLITSYLCHILHLIAAKYCDPTRAPWELSGNGMDLAFHIDLLSKAIFQPTKKQGKIIPAYLGIRHPLKRQHSPESYGRGCVYIYLQEVDKTTPAMSDYSNPHVDFIFTNPFEISDDQVTHELSLDTLYDISSDPALNRSHLAKQRFVHFWESHGYDSFQYAFKDGQMACVIFRPDQVYRLDRPDLTLNRDINSPKNKIELNKIYYLYSRSYKPHKIDCTEKLERAGARDLWCNRHHER